MSRVHRLLTVPVTATLIGTACSCAAPAPHPAAPLAVPDPAVDLHQPGRVCDAFAGAVYRVDTTVDRGPQDAYLRATPYLDVALANAIVAARPVPDDPQWQQWATHHAYTDIEISEYAGDALLPDSSTERHHATVATVAPIGRDGWHGQTQRHTVTCTLQQTDDGWRISAYETS